MALTDLLLAFLLGIAVGVVWQEIHFRDVSRALRDAEARMDALEAREQRDKRTINLNDRVLVDLTATGARMWRVAYKSEPPTYVDLPLSLWEVANVFGSSLYNDSTDLPFMSMELKVVP